MEILRVPPYPITTTWNLPEGNYDYIVYVEDLVDHSFEETTITSDNNGVVLYTIPFSKTQFDRNFLIRFYDSEHEHIIQEANLDIVRPYVNPALLGTTSSEVAEYKNWELVARSLIDTYTRRGFYNHKSTFQTFGSGADYLPVWRDANRVLKVIENNTVIYDIDTPDEYDFAFKVSLDNSAIFRVEADTARRLGNPPIRLPVSQGDLSRATYNYGSFPQGFDYEFVLDQGFRVVPADIEKAALMLIDDLKCGRLDYYQKYVTGYNTDQFRIQFDKRMLEGTGNLLVDKILDKYMKSISRIGVL